MTLAALKTNALINDKHIFSKGTYRYHIVLKMLQTGKYHLHTFLSHLLSQDKILAFQDLLFQGYSVEDLYLTG